MRLLRKTLYAAGALAIIAAIGISGTIAGVEKYCVADGPVPIVRSDFGIADDGYKRAQGDSFLTFPEWYIVHAYTDLAGVTEKSSESSFRYLASIRGFWRRDAAGVALGAGQRRPEGDQLHYRLQLHR